MGFDSPRGCGAIKVPSRPARLPAAAPAPGWRGRRPASGSRARERGFQRSSGIIDCSLVRRSSTSLLGSVIVSLAVTSVIASLSSARMIPVSTRPSVGGDHVRQIVLADQGAGVEDVREQVVEVGPVRAGQVGADLAADAEEGVALLADLGEDRPPERAVGGLGGLRREHRLVPGRSAGPGRRSSRGRFPRPWPI